MAEHGTRTMYVHYGCRCEACCKAEHIQYLKRKETQDRTRTRSKWGEGAFSLECKTEKQKRQRKYYENRKAKLSTHTRPIAWHQISEKYDMKCVICGCEVNPKDTWIGKNNRKCYGRTYPTVDHIIPLKHGGKDTLDNVQLACKRCNSSKGANYEFG